MVSIDYIPDYIDEVLLKETSKIYKETKEKSLVIRTYIKGMHKNTVHYLVGEEDFFNDNEEFSELVDALEYYNEYGE